MLWNSLRHILQHESNSGRPFTIHFSTESNQHNLPVWHCAPVYVGGQLQTYPLTWSVQDPPFKHGLLEHSSISMRQTNQIRTIKKSLEKKKITLACMYNLLLY